MTERLLAPLRPDECALVALFQAHFDDSMLRQIAEADYGEKADECFAMLSPMLRSGGRAPNDPFLREVLDLTRWSEPDDPTWRPGGQGERGHWMRLFACTALVRWAPDHREFFDGECNTLAQFIASAIELGPPVAHAAASVLAWRFLTYAGAESDVVYFSFGILLLVAYLERSEESGPRLKQLAAWVEDEEARVRKAQSEWMRHGEYWNISLMGEAGHELRASVWRGLAYKILARPERPHPAAARESLQLLGELVAGI